MNKITLSLAIILSSLHCASQELLQNGHFTSNNSGWSTTGDFSYNTTFSQYNFDVGYAYTDDAPNAGGTMEQQVTIPSNAANVELEFYTLINSDENTSTQLYDICSIHMFEVGGTGNTHQFIMLSNLDENYASGYQHYSFTVPPSFHGMDVRLVFIFGNDGATASRFRFDNVSLFATTSGGGSNPDFYIFNQNIDVSNAQVGDDINVSCNQGNQGILSSSVSVDLGYYLSTDQVLSGNDYLFASNIDVSSLSANDPDDSESESLTIPSWVSTGQYYILFAADYNGQILESDENNNVSSAPIYINAVTPPPTVELISPNTYMCIPFNTPLTIETNISGIITGKKAEYSLDNGSTWTLIDDDYSSNTTFSPVFITPNVNVVEECLIKVTAFSNSGNQIDISDCPFAISPPVQPELFDFNDISHISWPFEGTWEVNNWKNGSYTWYGGSHHGQGLHTGADYYSVDYVEISGVFYDQPLTCQSPFVSPINGIILKKVDSFNALCADAVNNHYGNQVIIQSYTHHDFAFRVAHLFSVDTELEEGDTVHIGDILGYVGSTGAYQPHAHCTLYKNIFVEIPFLSGETMYDRLISGNGLNPQDPTQSNQAIFYAAHFEFDGSELLGGGSSNLSQNTPRLIENIIVPNPSNGYFTIKNFDIYTANDFTIRDIQSRVVRYEVIDKNTFKVKEVPGIYFIIFKSDSGQVSSHKLIVSPY